MDLTQTKLTKAEWESIEKPVNKDEKKIINLITKGFYNTDVKYNDNLSLIEFININDINDAVSKIETSQDNLNTNLNDSLSNLATNTENTNQSIISLKKAMQEMVTLSE